MLLVRPSVNSDECIISYMLRLSEQNGFKHIGYLLRYAGLKWKNNRAPLHQILAGDFDLTPYLIALGLPEHHSRIKHIYLTFKRAIDTPYLITKHPKVCPDCIEEFGYCKYEWNFLPMLTCVKHKKMLIDTHPETGKKLCWYRQNLNKFDSDSGIFKPARSTAPPIAITLSQYIEALLSNRKINTAVPVILHDLELRESLSLIHFIAHYQARLLGDSFSPLAMHNYELAQNYQNVWKILTDWPDSFYALLSQYIDQPLSSRGIGGLNKHYRDLYERLHRQQQNKGIFRIKTEFDRYIEAYWPGVLDLNRVTRINLTSPTRNIISKNEVARIIGCRLERIDKLVQQEKLTPVLFKGKAHYQRDQAESLAAIIQENWTMSEACKALQLTRYQLKQLLDAGLFQALQKPDSLNRDWIIDKAHSQKVIKGLRIKAREQPPPGEALTMTALYRLGYSIVQLVLAMQAGKLCYCTTNDENHPHSFKQFVAFWFTDQS